MPEIIDVTNTNRKGLSVISFLIAILLILILIFKEVSQTLKTVAVFFAILSFLLGIKLLLCPIKERTT